jgi:nitric oxide reductase subunit C
MDNEKAARLGKIFFFTGSLACLGVMFSYLTPATLAYINQSNHIEGQGIPAEVVRGKQAFHKFVCMDCHTIMGDGTQYAPELGRIAIKRDADFLRKYVKDAHAINPNTGMPTFSAMTDQEAQDLASFLEWTSKINLPEGLWAEMKAAHDPYDARAYKSETNPFYRSYWPPRPMSAEKSQAAAPANADPLVAEGAKLFHANQLASCETCHQVGGQGGTIGPDLSQVGSPDHKSRYGAATDAKFLATKLVDPGADTPQKSSAMPSFKGLPDRERQAIVAYLLSLKH